MKTRLLVVALVAGVLLPARSAAAASLVDTFFGTVKKFHPKPDQVEAARYYVVHPTHAQPIYTKVSGQDYVFIGLLAAAKVARGQNLFTYKTCMTPVTAFDSIFRKSKEFT